MDFATLADKWTGLGCPDSTNTPRGTDYVTRAISALRQPKAFMGEANIQTLGPRKATIDYGVWRRGISDNGGGARATDIELAACSAMFRWAVRMELVAGNPFHGRGRFQHGDEIVHCTERAPESADLVHQIGELLLADARSRSAGFLWLFLCLTGCRCGELRALRLDVKPSGVKMPPGLYTCHEIIIARGKQTQAGSSRHPYGVIPLSPPAQELLSAWESWHRTECACSPFWFPGMNMQVPLSSCSLTKALARICRRHGLPHVSAHGARAFFTRTFRQDEPDDRIVAARLGHTNVGMVERIYGGRMQEKNPKLSWLPTGKPAWHQFISNAIG